MDEVRAWFKDHIRDGRYTGKCEKKLRKGKRIDEAQC